jgi:hypothetical protein
MTIAPWKHQPVFISSTFRDMNAERDALRLIAFPALAERLRARRCHIESVDLRWGVETGSIDDPVAKEFQVLKVCLDDVQGTFSAAPQAKRAKPKVQSKKKRDA